MEEGLLWFDNDAKRDLAQKVGRAAQHYRRKFGRPPNVCYVHPSLLTDGAQRIDGVHVAALPSILRHHFWIGEERRTEALDSTASAAPQKPAAPAAPERKLQLWEIDTQAKDGS
jgi:hypothetical protein